MYNHFFGFKEKPFKLVPDPDYLFLSPCHEEALAHLTYAVSEGEGFVELIGEVGTGKTMLCRAFLNNLGPDTESAYIFNPKMDAADLLRAINDEFGIPAKPEDGTKELIDALNTFLMEKKREGKRAILLIDEAQNLSREVLEQVRLLSNLETSKEKLLQIILAGQPELGEMLDSYELRQLGQRITLSCRLGPLTLSETREYIRHRIHVASQKPARIFSWAAVWRIHRYSGGIPRLINIASDRALLTAYGLNRRRVSGKIARNAILELSSRGQRNRAMARPGPIQALALFFCGAALLLVWAYQSEIRSVLADMSPPGALFSSIPQEKTKPRSPAVKKSKLQDVPQQKPAASPSGETPPVPPINPQEASAAEEASAEPAPERPVIEEKMGLGQALQSLDPGGSRAESMAVLLDQWGISARIPGELSDMEDQTAFFSLAARQHGLASYPIRGNLALLKNLNVCAILEFMPPEASSPVYLTAVEAGKNAMSFTEADDLRIFAPNEEIARYWTGNAYVFWKNFYNYQGIVPQTAPRESIIALKLHLREIGYDQVRIEADYGNDAMMAIKDIQARSGIPVDGYVGPLTQIVLYNASPAFQIPHLWGDEADEPDGAQQNQAGPAAYSILHSR